MAGSSVSEDRTWIAVSRSEEAALHASSRVSSVDHFSHHHLTSSALETFMLFLFQASSPAHLYDAFYLIYTMPCESRVNMLLRT